MRRSIAIFLFSGVSVLGCSKGLSIGDHKLTVPPGCTSESTATTGRISCAANHTELSWLRVEGDGTAELDKDEGIIRDAFKDSKTKLETDEPKCTVGGADARCRRVRQGKVTLAVMGVAASAGKTFFVECAYDGTGTAPPPACNGLFSLP